MFIKIQNKDYSHFSVVLNEHSKPEAIVALVGNNAKKQLFKNSLSFSEIESTIPYLLRYPIG